MMAKIMRFSSFGIIFITFFIVEWDKKKRKKVFYEIHVYDSRERGGGLYYCKFYKFMCPSFLPIDKALTSSGHINRKKMYWPSLIKFNRRKWNSLHDDEIVNIYEPFRVERWW